MRDDGVFFVEQSRRNTPFTHVKLSIEDTLNEGNV